MVRVLLTDASPDDAAWLAPAAARLFRAAFEADKLKDNLLAVVRDVRKAKPATAKGVYIKKVTLSTTMGPGVRVDVGSLPE